MNHFRTVLFMLAIAVPSMTAAQTMRFEDSMAVLGESCGKDIDDNCRGVNLDPGRMKDCLNRNQDGLSQKCKGDYPRAFDALQKRLSVRAAVWKNCENDAAKVCGETEKQVGRNLQCLLTAQRVSVACNRAIAAAGYR